MRSAVQARECASLGDTAIKFGVSLYFKSFSIISGRMGRGKGEKKKNGEKNVKNKLGYARAAHLHRCAVFLSNLGELFLYSC